MFEESILKIKTNRKIPIKVYLSSYFNPLQTKPTNFCINSCIHCLIPRIDPLKAFHEYINTLYILCILIASLFLPLRRSTVTNRVVSFLPTSLVYPSFIVRFSRGTSHLRGRRGKRRGRERRTEPSRLSFEEPSTL